MISRIVAYETKIRIFQYQLLNNYYILIKSYFISVKSPSLNIPSVNYMMRHRSIFFTNALMHKIYGTSYDDIFQKESVTLPVLNPQSAIFGFTNVFDNNYLLVNYLLLIFKCNVWNSRVNHALSFQSLKCVISQINYIEETISENDPNKKRKLLNKWKLIDHLF